METTAQSRPRKKVTCRLAEPNPQIRKILYELYQQSQASEKYKKFSLKLKYAINALDKHPLPIAKAADCIMLNGFDKKLCKYVDDLLNASSQASNDCDNSLPNGTSSAMSAVDLNVNGNPVNNSTQKTTKKSKTSTTPKNKLYKPAHRSGGYAILVALYEITTENPNTLISKEELIDRAQNHSEESFTRPKPDNPGYTAWSSMSRLLRKDLVKKTSQKKSMYRLTEAGFSLAKELLEDSRNIPTANYIIFNDAPSTSGSQIEQNDDAMEEIQVPDVQSPNEDVINLPAGTFDIILLIDKNETSGRRNDPTVAQFNKYPDLKHEFRSLKVGDFVWVARDRENKDKELVLPYVVERKRMDDLGASIKDGRFHEQKFRLRKCGLDNVIYLIEKYGNKQGQQWAGLPLQSLHQALSNTRIQDEFKVHTTDSLAHSARFLAMMTKRLTIRYKDKHLQGWNRDSIRDRWMSFNYFNQASAKNKRLSVKEYFIKMLLQLRGVSPEKVVAITNKYSTPGSLIYTCLHGNRSEVENLLANIKYGPYDRNVGPAVSKALYQIYACIGP